MRDQEKQQISQDLVNAWQQADENFDKGNIVEGLIAQIRCAFLWNKLYVPKTQHDFSDFIKDFEALEQSSIPYRDPKPAYLHDFLIPLIPYLDAAIQATLIETLLEDHSVRFDTLLPYLNPSQLLSTYESAVERNQLSSWISLAPYLPPSLLKEVWTLAQGMLDDIRTSPKMGTFALYLPKEEREAALQGFFTIKDEHKRCDIFRAILPRLTSEEVNMVLKNVLAMDSPSIVHSKISLCLQLIPMLSDEVCNALYDSLSMLKVSFFGRLIESFANRMPAIDILPHFIDIERDDEVFWRLLGMWVAQKEERFQEPFWINAFESLENLPFEARLYARLSLLKYLNGVVRQDILGKLYKEIDNEIPSSEKENLLISLSGVLRDNEFPEFVTLVLKLQPPDDQERVMACIFFSLPNTFLPEKITWACTYKFVWTDESLGKMVKDWARQDRKAVYEAWKALLHAYADLPLEEFSKFLEHMLPFIMYLAGDNRFQVALHLYRIATEIYEIPAVPFDKYV